MNLLNLTDDDIATLRGSSPKLKACPHWSRWEMLTLASGASVVMFRCDNPKGNTSSLGDLPIAKTCQVEWGAYATPSELALWAPTISFVYLKESPPRKGHPLTHLDPLVTGKRDPEELWQEARKKLLGVKRLCTSIT